MVTHNRLRSFSGIVITPTRSHQWLNSPHSCPWAGSIRESSVLVNPVATVATSDALPTVHYPLREKNNKNWRKVKLCLNECYNLRTGPPTVCTDHEILNVIEFQYFKTMACLGKKKSVFSYERDMENWNVYVHEQKFLQVFLFSTITLKKTHSLKKIRCIG